MSRTIAIALVDDDEAVLDSLRLYFVAIGHDVAAYPEADSLAQGIGQGIQSRLHRQRHPHAGPVRA